MAGRPLRTLAALASICAAGLHGQPADTLVILHTSDTHLVFEPGMFLPRLAESFTDHRLSTDSLERFLQTVPGREKADAVIITGDILACFEGETPSGQMHARQVEQFRPLYDRCPVPLFLTLGNHDISSYAAFRPDSGIVTAQTEAGRARASWVRNIPCFADGTWYEHDLTVEGTRYHCLFLDDGYSLHEGGKRLEKMQVDWLNDRLDRAGKDPVIVFHHIYFPIGDVNGDGVAFDARKPVDWPSEKDCSEGFLRALNEHPNVKALIVGHGHENVFEKIRFPAGHGVWQVETGSVTEASANWRLIRLSGSSILISRPGSRNTQISIDINEKAKDNGRTR